MPYTNPVISRLAFVAGGCFFTTLAVIGVLMPVVPATPFVLLASACFVRSSPRFHGWLRRSPVLGKLLRDWEVRGGITRQVRWTAILLAAAGATMSIASGYLPLAAQIVAGLIAVAGIVFVAWLPSAR